MIHTEHSLIPLVLLIAANDREEYLANIPAEKNKLEKILSPVCEKLKYEFKSITYSSSFELIDIININKQRLLIIHFAGHSTGSYLKLDEGEIYAKGLANKLASCYQLQLVFLNGCNNAKQVEIFVDSGLNSIIGTSQKINDGIAIKFSLQFYKALGEQELNIQGAFKQAQNDIETKTKSKDIYRSLDSNYNSQDTWAWLLETNTPDWKLRNASDPCNQLPPLPRKELPPKPFKNLHYYREEDAEIFFGRCKATRDLLELLNEPEPLILLHGGTGVGKSSFLQAGFIPRLKTHGQSVQYFRYNEIKNRNNILKQLFGSEDMNNIRQVLHSKKDYPNVWILDQAEELFFEQNENISRIDASSHIHFLLGTLRSIFYPNDPELYPNAKFIIALRTEWYGRFQDLCIKKYLINYQHQLLSALDKPSIIEVIESLMSKNYLKRRYKLKILNPKDGRLAEQMADDLLEDEDSNIAPILQISLDKLWEKVEQKKVRIWDIKLYLRLKKKGLLLVDFFDQQIDAIAKEEKWGGQAKESGLILDVLNSHIDKNTFPILINFDKYNKLYKHISYRKELLFSLINKHLLTDFYKKNGSDKNILFTRISHDSIIKIIAIKFSESELPGQKAKRELKERKKSWKYIDNKYQGPVFDKDTLRIIEKGKNGTIFWGRGSLEEKIIEKSKSNNRRIIIFTHISKVLLVLFIAVVIFVFIMTPILSKQIRFDNYYEEYKNIKREFKENFINKDIVILESIQSIINSIDEFDFDKNTQEKYLIKKYTAISDLYLIKSTIYFRLNSYDKYNGIINKSSSFSIKNGKKWLALTTKFKLSKRNYEQQSYYNALFNQLYAHSIKYCLNGANIEKIKLIISLLPENYLKINISPKNDTCLYKTYTYTNTGE